MAVLDNQWFIDFNANDWKIKSTKCLEKIELWPENMRKLFLDTFNWLDKRPCARKRGLGTKLPFDNEWVIESLSDSTIYMTLYTIQNIIKKNKLKKENLTREFFDYVYLKKRDLKEVAKMTGVNERILKEAQESFSYWMPMDHRHTFALHLSNHLSFMIFAFAALFPEIDWPKRITFHGLVISEGAKMSKSKGNVITLLHVKNKYGADTLRFYMTSSTNVESTFDWKETEAKNAKQNIEKIFSILNEAIDKKKKGIISSLFASRFNRILKTAEEKISKMRFREYNGAVVYDMLNLVKEAKIYLNDDELSYFYDYIADKWIRAIAPIIPHIAEELWHKLGGKGFVSLSDWPIADEKKIDPKLEESEKIVDKTVSDILNVLKIIKEKQGKDAEKIYLYVLPKELGSYNQNLFTKRVGKDVVIYAVNDKNKHDPEGKAGKAKPGKPGIYVE